MRLAEKLPDAIPAMQSHAIWLYRLCVALLLQLIMLVAPAGAQTARPANHIAAQLVVEGPAKPSETVWLALHMRPEPGWHGYWSNPGDAGLGMTLDWSLPAGASAGAPLYPVPETLLVSGLMNHVYKGDHAVLVPLRLTAGTGAENQPITVKAQWLACTDAVCVPESATLRTVLPATLTGVGPRDARFDAWRRALPSPLGAEAQFTIDGARLRLAIPLPASAALDRPHLFLAEDKVVDYAARQAFSRRGDTLIVEVPRAKFAAIFPDRITAVLRLEQGQGLALEGRRGAVPPAGKPIADAGAPGWASLPALLAGALLGGLLLNIMPCVFPILSLKALSLARAGESATMARREGMAYAAGVVIACLALGGMLLALRAAGKEVGWAFQLQEPAVVVALLLLAAALTANLLGLFELTLPGFASSGQNKAGERRGAFATGLLAAFVATPCTGPFMATAMGAALLLPVLPALLLFAALGLGIALPFLALAFVPVLRGLLPRPGAWMNTFRRWMALPMGLTALALLWLCARLGGTAFVGICALLAAGLVVALQAAGREQRAGRSGIRRFALNAALLMLIAGTALPYVFVPQSSESAGVLDAQTFSAQALDDARTSGKPVFVWFTADWCLTCKVNERVAIEKPAVRDAFAKAGVVVLRGDWTRRDPAITWFLTEHGAAGVPLYLWYPAGGGAPRQLPQILTPGSLEAEAAR